MTRSGNNRFPFQATCFMLLALATYFFVSVLGSGCGGGGFFSSKATPTSSSTSSGTATATATPGKLSGDVLIAGGMNNTGAVVGQAELYEPATDTFSTTGSLNTARVFHTATLLNSGLVLIAGGQKADGTALNTAELYDSDNQTFTLATGDLNAGRTLATATLLSDGKVLITGGIDSSGVPLASAELYDPGTETFTTTAGAMNFARASHTATLLQNGMVLIAGGYSNASATAIVQRAELYNPATQTFSLTANLIVACYSQAAAIFPPGSALAGEVLIAGGVTITGVTRAAEVYNPGTGAFASAGNMTSSREQFTAVLLNSGLVLLAGGLTNLDLVTGTAELYNPGGLFTPTGNMTTSRQLQTATLFTSGTDAGQVLIVGGETGSAFSTATATAELYNPALSGFTATGSMANARFGHTATLFP
jgi:hypothetical protein